ncbi:mycofactocin biosynthesis peptidyl-dipeptidase MftE [Nocardioides sp. Leaf374]|uniref:mycofactocin biosynthesis peptidyl-dipeptidase MftE n=1 Tax=Nocardioides sp. Leaf374 TaxID=2876560 RepID=UPI001E5E3AE3|nr:mycofactocin biosynthesis peptidyl-dipeptidase MftE [Nocardioides sp. Leaf374]
MDPHPAPAGVATPVDRRDLADATWPDLPATPTVLVPLGSLEQHGPHLPLDTDAAIADAVARRVAELLGPDGSGDLWVAPPVVYAASGEHQMFAGTASIGTDALRALLVELTRSLRTWAGRVVFVNAHGGNLQALGAALRQLRAEGHDVTWAPCATEEVDAHAGYTETSLMLHLRPASVRLDRAVAGNTTPVHELLPALRSGGVGAVSANGVLGDPAGASAAEGERVLEAMARDVVERLAREGTAAAQPAGAPA